MRATLYCVEVGQTHLAKVVWFHHSKSYFDINVALGFIQDEASIENQSADQVRICVYFISFIFIVRQNLISISACGSIEYIMHFKSGIYSICRQTYTFPACCDCITSPQLVVKRALVVQAIIYIYIYILRPKLTQC